jgi:4-amino-4-deoxy-L-arabinose transferase-like glycosyltransferase
MPKSRIFKGGLPSLIPPLFYLLLRLPGLMALPLFNDEAVYLWRAQRFPHLLGPSGFNSGTLADGKLLQELALAGLVRLPGDPLLPARLLALACGLGVVLALALCGRRLDRPGAGLLAGLLYALSPLAQVHDRLALPDSMLTMVSAFLLVASIGYAQGQTAGRREALGLGALVGAAALVKLSGLLLAATPVLAVLLLAPPGERRRRLGQLRLSLIVALALLAALAPFHYGGAERQKMGTQVSRLELIGQNSLNIGLWLLRYLPGPLLALPLAALGAGAAPQTLMLFGVGGRAAHTKQQINAGAALPPPPPHREVGFLLATGLSLPAAFAVVGGSLASRYVMPAWPALLLAAGLGAQLLWERAERRVIGRGLVLLSLGAAALWGGYFDLRYATDPRSAPLDTGDRWQYTQSWTAGYALFPLLDQVQENAAAEGPITLVLQAQPRLATLGAQIYLSQRADIRLAEVELSQAEAPRQLRALAGREPTYVLADSQVAAAYGLPERFPGLTPVSEEANPGGAISFWLFAQAP